MKIINLLNVSRDSLFCIIKHNNWVIYLAHISVINHVSLLPRLPTTWRIFVKTPRPVLGVDLRLCRTFGGVALSPDPRPISIGISLTVFFTVHLLMTFSNHMVMWNLTWRGTAWSVAGRAVFLNYSGLLRPVGRETSKLINQGKPLFTNSVLRNHENM